MKKFLMFLSLIMAVSLFFTSCSCDFLPPKDEAEKEEKSEENSQHSEDSDDSEEKIVYKYIYEECDEEDCDCDCNCDCDRDDYKKNEDENESETIPAQTSTKIYKSKPEIDDTAYYWWYCDDKGFCEDSYGNKWDNTITL
ncbi:hypothetical protein GF366_02420 [Candidatus Peregrinibacteria bacterium]|nr:hypothetical protein [Candidatus Peregrinibacteria bacterium]